MLLDCKQCGAPLDVAENAFLATCAYCRHTQAVRKSIYKRPDDWRETPANWQPPPQWTPPPQAPQASVPLTYQPARARRKSSLVRTSILAGVMVVALAGAGGGVWLVMAQGASGSVAGEPVSVDGPPGETWDGRNAMRCEGRVTISGRTVKATTSPAVNAGIGCELVIDNAKIEADELVRGDVAITITNSELTLKRGLATSSNHIVVRGSTLTFAGEGPLLWTSGNGDITIDNTTIEARPTGGELVIAKSTGNGSPRLSNAIVRVQGAASPLVLFDTGGNGTGSFTNSTIDAEGKAVTLRTVRPATVSNAELGSSKLVGDPPAR